MSDDLQEFALKVADALDIYAARGETSISPGKVPFHVSMMKMAQCLKHRQRQGLKKQAFLGALTTLAPGLMAGLGGHSMYKYLKPGMESAAVRNMRPADLMGEAMTALGRKAGPSPGAAEDAILAAIQKFAPGQQALARAGQVHSERSMRPYAMGLAGLGGLAAGQMYSNRGQSGPPDDHRIRTDGSMNNTFTPKLAAMTSKAIRDLSKQNTKLASHNGELQEKVAALEEERDCRRLAADMAEQGMIDVNDVEKTATALKGQDLEVVKQAMTWRTPASLSIGEPTSPGNVAGDDVDPITRACLED